jgi:hypothetical protein
MTSSPATPPYQQAAPLTADEVRAGISSIQRRRRDLAGRTDLLSVFPPAGFAEAAQVLVGDHPYVQLLYEQRARYLSLRQQCDELWKHGDIKHATKVEQTLVSHLSSIRSIIDAVCDIERGVAQDFSELTQAADQMAQRKVEHADKISILKSRTNPGTISEEELMQMAGLVSTQVPSTPVREGTNQHTAMPRYPETAFSPAQGPGTDFQQNRVAPDAQNE